MAERITTSSFGSPDQFVAEVNARLRKGHGVDANDWFSARELNEGPDFAPTLWPRFVSAPDVCTLEPRIPVKLGKPRRRNVVIPGSLGEFIQQRELELREWVVSGVEDGLRVGTDGRMTGVPSTPKQVELAAGLSRTRINDIKRGETDGTPATIRRLEAALAFTLHGLDPALSNNQATTGTDPELLQLGRKLFEMRKSLGWSQARLASALGYARERSVANIESGRVTPSPRMQKAIDRFFTERDKGSVTE